MSAYSPRTPRSRWLVVLAVLAAGCGTSRPADTAGPPSAREEKRDRDDRYVEIQIDGMNGWYLRVFPSGGGIVGYGSSGPDGRDFPGGTLDFDAMVRELTPRLPGKGGAGGCEVAMVLPNTSTTTTRHLDHRGIVLPWLRKAMDAVPDRPARLDEIWLQYPPGGPDR